MTSIQFFDDPNFEPGKPAKVRIKTIGLYVHENGRRVTFGLELTPFMARPSVDVAIENVLGQSAGALTVIETMTPNFSLVIHLRDDELRDPYRMSVDIYFATPETERTTVDSQTIEFETSVPGEQLFRF